MNTRRAFPSAMCLLFGAFLSLNGAIQAAKDTPLASGPAPDLNERLNALLRERASDVVMVDRIVAWVDDEAITLGEVEEALFEYQSVGSVSSGPPAPNRLRESLGLLIDDRLILKAAEKAGIVVAPEKVDNRVEETIRRMAEAQGGDEALEAVLRRAGRGGGERGVDSLRERLRDRFRREWTIAQAVNTRFTLSDDEVARFERERESQGRPTTRYRLSHLFFPISSAAPAKVWDEAMERAHEARIEAQRRGDFAAVAEEWASRLAGGDVQGGTLGVLAPDEMLPALAQAASRLEPGQSSPPIRTGKGIHVLYLESKTTALELLHAQRYDEEKARWAGQLRVKATIRFLDPELRPERIKTLSPKKPAAASDE